MMQQKQQESREPYRSVSCDGPAAIPDGYADLRRGLAWGDLGRRLVLTARGPDAVRFVDNFTTAALSALAEGAGTEGFFADARGWVLALTSILRIEDGVWIDAPAGLASPALCRAGPGRAGGSNPEKFCPSIRAIRQKLG